MAAHSSIHELTVTPTSGQPFGALMLTDKVSEWLSSIGEDISEINKITWRYGGCSNYSEAVILCPYANAVALLASPVGTSDIQIGNQSGTSKELFYAASMYLVEARPSHLSFNSGGTPFDGLYICKFVDKRYFLRGISTPEAIGYNLTTTQDRTKYYDQSTSSGTAYTWAQIISALLTTLKISATNNLTYSGAGTPNDYLMSGENAAEMLDRVLCALGACLVAMPDGTYIIDQLQQFNQAQASQLDAYVSERTAGGILYGASQFSSILNSIMPATVTVKFPRQLATYDDSKASTKPPVMNQWKVVQSTANKPPSVSGRSGLEAIVYDTLWAIGAPGSETNSSNLMTRADFIAGVYYQRWKSFGTNTRFRGILDPELPTTGTFVYHHTSGGTFTDFHNDFYGFPVGGDMDAVGGLSIRRVETSGGIQAWKSFDGTLYLSGSTPLGVFPVHVSSDGGTGGSNTTTANLTYTVKSISNASLANGTSNTTTLASPEHNVRLANVTYSTPSNGSIGTACYDVASPPVLHLLYVPEKPSPTQCS